MNSRSVLTTWPHEVKLLIMVMLWNLKFETQTYKFSFRNRGWRRLSWKKSRDKSEHSSHWWEKNIIKIWFLLKNILDFLFIALSRIFPITNVFVLTAESKNHFDLIYCFPSTFVKNTSSPYSNVTTVFYIFFEAWYVLIILFK